jgi:hypothetical protein
MQVSPVSVMRRVSERPSYKMADPERRQLDLVSNGVRPFNYFAFRHAHRTERYLWQSIVHE